MLSVRMKMGTRHWYRFSALFIVFMSSKSMQKEVVKLIYQNEVKVPEHTNIVTFILFCSSISVCHLWFWHPFLLVYYYVTEHHCTMFLHLSCHCWFRTHFLLFVTLFYHTQIPYAASKCRVAELSNSTTHFCSDIVIPEHSDRITIHMGLSNSSIPKS